MPDRRYSRRTFAAAGTAAGMAMLVRASQARAEGGQAVLERADLRRNPKTPFRMTNTVIEYHGGVAKQKLQLQIHAKLDPATGRFRNLVRYIMPAKDAGKILLLNGKIMWFYDPASSATVRISPQQRLLGQASNADVVAVNLAKDYEVKSAAQETVTDADRKPRQAWLLQLAPLGEYAMYGRIDYWVEVGTDLPVKGRFFSDSGRLLKVVYYRAYQSQLGGVRPTEALIVDELNANLVTTMGFSAYEAFDTPDSWFQRDSLQSIGRR